MKRKKMNAIEREDNLDDYRQGKLRKALKQVQITQAYSIDLSHIYQIPH